MYYKLSFKVLVFLFNFHLLFSQVIYPIFADNIVNSDDWSWGCVITISSTNVNQGYSSLKVEYITNTGAWPGLYLNIKDPLRSIVAINLKTLEFDLLSSVLPKARVCLYDLNKASFCKEIPKNCSLNSYCHYSFSLDFFKGKNVAGFVVQTLDDSYKQILFLDNIYFSGFNIQENTTLDKIFIFSDNFINSRDYSWSVINEISAEKFFEGKSSLKVKYNINTNAWPALYLFLENDFNSILANEFKSLEFDIYSSKKMKLKLCLREKTTLKDYCKTDFVNTCQINTFCHVSVSPKFFEGLIISGLILQTTDDKYSQTIYIDNIYFQKYGINPVPTPTPTPAPVPAICLTNSTNSVKSKGSISINLSNRLLVGLFLDDEQKFMKNSNVPWDVQYRYLTKGWANNWGWGNYDGSFAFNFMQNVDDEGFIPAIQYYQIVGESPYSNDESKFVWKLQNKEIMTSYFKDFILLMTQIKKFGKPVFLLLEADGFAFSQIQSNENPDLYASISDTGLPELNGLENKVSNFGLALLKIRLALGATNAYMGIHVSAWASQKDIMFNSENIPLQPEVDKVYNFLKPFGLNKDNSIQQEFDFLVSDPLDRDADYYVNVKNQNRWLNTSEYASIDSKSFNRYAEWLRLWNEKSGKKWILWQIPLGNSNHLNIPNTNSNPRAGYKDNRPEYFFGDNGICHCKKFAESGVYALLFGRGEGTQSNYINDYYTDGELFMKTRVKNNYYDKGGISIQRESS